MPGITVIVPVKPLDEGKSRLAPLLPPAERRALNGEFLRRTLSLAEELAGAAATIVVSRSGEVLALAARRSMVALPEEPDCGLNGALEQASRVARGRGAAGILILPVDLPLATAAAIRRVTAGPHRETGGRCIIVPDRTGTGTNLLFQAPPALDRYSYGEGSLQRHRSAAERAGLTTVIRHDPDLAFDIDRPEDLVGWRARLERRDAGAACPSS